MRSGFEDMQFGILVRFDFSNAFRSLSHSFIAAVLKLTCLPQTYIAFILSTLVAPFHFHVGRGVVREIFFLLKAGFGQGDPFSPVLFSFCAAFVLYRIDQIPRSGPYMYADDLCVLISGRQIVPLL